MTKDEFIEVFDPYYNNLLSYVSHITIDTSLAEEVTQEIYIQAFKNPEAFLHADSIEAMLKSAAKNKFLSINKKELHQSKLTKKIVASLINEHVELLEELLDAKELHNFLLLAMNQLPPILRQIIQLNFLDDISMIEISSILNVKYTTALSRKNKALKELKRLMIKIEKEGYYCKVLEYEQIKRIKRLELKFAKLLRSTIESDPDLFGERKNSVNYDFLDKDAKKKDE